MTFTQIFTKPMPGYEDRYSVSLDGRIWSLRWKRWRKLSRNQNGYHFVFAFDGQKNKRVSVHRAMALLFLPNPENKRCVNHINGVRTDNRIENLEWVTHSENTRHAVKIGTFKDNRGQGNPKSKLTDRDVKRIKRLAKPGLFGQFAREYGVHPTTISGIINGKYWRHI